MAVPAVAELSLHRMVDVAGWERFVRRQQLKCIEKGRVEMGAVHAPFDAFEIAPEPSRPLDNPHAPISQWISLAAVLSLAG